MPGVFPDSGVAAGQATNTVDVDTTNCDGNELWHSTTRCQPRFDPAAANAVMSEILNAVTSVCEGTPAGQAVAYDCDSLTNLSDAICRKIVQVIQNGCYTLDDLGDNCDQTSTPVHFINDGGCGRLVRVEDEPLPQGFNLLTRAVFGTVTTTIGADPQSQRVRDAVEAVEGPQPQNEFYELFNNAPDITIRANQFCALRNAGTPLRFRSDVKLGYNMEVANPPPNPNINPYQVAVVVFLDGNPIALAPDAWPLAQRGDNGFVADMQDANFNTTGADLVFTIVPYLRALTPSPFYNAGDTFNLDMAQVGITYESRF